MSAYIFAFVGLQDSGIDSPALYAGIVVLVYSVLGGLFAIIKGGTKYFSYNASVLGFFSTVIIVISFLFHFVFGLKFSYMFKSWLEKL